MTDVRFYVLAGQSQKDQWQFACRLVEQISRKNNQVLIQLNNSQEAQAFSELLWCFRQDAFVPHTLLNDTNMPDNCAINIGWQHDPGHHHDILINLSHTLPHCYSRFQRLVEIVVQQDDVLNATRKHYKFLQDRGYPITHTDMRMR